MGACEAAIAPPAAQSRVEASPFWQSRRSETSRSDCRACRVPGGLVCANGRRYRLQDSRTSGEDPVHARHAGDLSLHRRIPVPGVNRDGLAGLHREQRSVGHAQSLLRSGLKNFSIVALGVYPYITASIIMQLMTPIIPRLNELSNEGQQRPQQDQSVHTLADRSARAAARLRSRASVLAQHAAPNGRPVAAKALASSIEHHAFCRLADSAFDDRGHDVAGLDGRVDHRDRDRQRRLDHHLRRHRRQSAELASVSS